MRFVVLALCVACIATPRPMSSEDGNPQIAAGLKGTLYYNLSWDLRAVDLTSGHERTVYTSSGDLFAVSPDGTEFAYATDTDRFEFDEIRLHGLDDVTPRAVIERERTIFGPAKISPDGSMVVANWHTSGEEFDTVTVFDRGGRTIARFAPYVSYAWQPNGRLLLVGEGGLWRASTDLSELTRIREFDPLPSGPDVMAHALC